MSEDFRTALGRTEDRIFERLEARFERLEAKFDLRLDTSDKDTQREFGEARRDLGELRDLVNKQGSRIDLMESASQSQLRSSAEGAAKGAGEAAGAVAATVARVTATAQAATAAKGFWASRVGKLVTICVGISAVGAAIDNVPKILAWVANAFHYLAATK